MLPMRSDAWYKGKDRDSYIHRAWMRRGLPANAFDGRPHIAIANTASDLAPCNSHLNEVMEYVKNGVWEADYKKAPLGSHGARRAMRSEPSATAPHRPAEPAGAT